MSNRHSVNHKTPGVTLLRQGDTVSHVLDKKTVLKHYIELLRQLQGDLLLKHTYSTLPYNHLSKSTSVHFFSWQRNFINEVNSLQTEAFLNFP